jgi:hypothetical protein
MRYGSHADIRDAGIGGFNLISRGTILSNESTVQASETTYSEQR